MDSHSLYKGSDSRRTLAHLFAMWLPDKGDISDRAAAPEFAAFVDFHSELSKSVIAVWLGLEEGAFREAPTSSPEPYWEFEGPFGEEVTIPREVFEADYAPFFEGGE